MKVNIIAVAAVSALLILGVAFVRRQLQPGTPPVASGHLNVSTGFPAFIQRDIAKLQGESLTESLRLLSHINMFFMPGPPVQGSIDYRTGQVPLHPVVGQIDLEAIMSNRRFRRIFDDLSKMDKAAASRIINHELAAAIIEYLPLYAGYMGSNALSYTVHAVARRKEEAARAGRVVAGPHFTVGNVKEGEVVVGGARYRVLALVWTAGMLGLTDCKDEIERVARLAMKQRTELYDETLDRSFKSRMLRMASLYNRQIIASGLIGVTVDGDREAAILRAASTEWQERQLVLATSPLTEYDRPVQSGIMKPNYSGGSLTVKFLSPMDDRSFDVALKELHLLP